MGEYNGKINVPKDTMLFVVNDVFEQDVKESTTKENILKMMPEIYKNAEDEEIIKMLPYQTYKDLEKLIEYTKTSNDIKTFFYQEEHQSVRYLEDAMIVVMRVKYLEYNYSVNPGVLEELKRIFTKENRAIAERYGELEKLIIGMLYTYGMVDFEFLKKKLCKYRSEVISERELREFYQTRLNLNLMVNDYDIQWTNSGEIQCFVTYLDEERILMDIGLIAEEQKARKMMYKPFSKEEILKREEYLWDARLQKLYQFLKSKNEELHEWKIKRIAKEQELGRNVLGELMELGQFTEEKDLKEFSKLFMEWYNNSPQYMLGGYSPNEMKKILKK